MDSTSTTRSGLCRKTDEQPSPASKTPKRKLPKRDLPYIGKLRDSLPFTKLPTNGTVLQRFLFIIETNHHSSVSPTDAVAITCKGLVAVWEYAGYGDILKIDMNIRKMIEKLRQEYRTLMKVPAQRKDTDKFKRKVVQFQENLENLCNITVAAKVDSCLITEDDRNFLLHHWRETVTPSGVCSTL